MNAEERKKAKTAYKEMRPVPGVFQIKNEATGMIFIGSSINLNAILNRHKAGLMFGKHENTRLQNDFNTYGLEQFTFEILDFIEPDPDPDYKYSDDVKVMESLWLEKLKPYGDNGYNTEST